MVKTLSENYDFIENSLEESYQQGYGDLTFNFDQTLVESLNANQANTSDRKGIIGIAEGVFFVPGGTSRNKRIYPQGLWEKVLDESLTNRVESRKMLGTIGHRDKKVDDEDWAKGEVSHVITELRIDDTGKVGLGKLEILDTEAGRKLKTFYDSGIPVYVSSRGGGKLKPGYGGSLPIVEQLFVETFDVVLDPGFLQAKPNYKRVHENLELNENISNKEDEMEIKAGMTTEEILKQILSPLQEQLIKPLQEQVSELNRRLDEEKEAKEKAEKDAKEKAEKEAKEAKEKQYKEMSEKYTNISEKLSKLPTELVESFEQYEFILKEDYKAQVESNLESSKILDKVSEELEKYKLKMDESVELVTKLKEEHEKEKEEYEKEKCEKDEKIKELEEALSALPKEKMDEDNNEAQELEEAEKIAEALKVAQEAEKEALKIAEAEILESLQENKKPEPKKTSRITFKK